MNSENLNNKNYLLYCASHYDKFQYHSTEEFQEDLKRIKYIRKLITRYIEKGELKERLILNHIIILNNVFGPEALVKILFLKLKDQMYYVKPFLILLEILPEKVYNVDNQDVIDTNLVSMDSNIIDKLRKI